jgi:tight adherence protein B
VTPLIVALAGAGVGMGLVMLASAWTAPPERLPRRTGPLIPAGTVTKAAAALAGAVLALVLTGWLVAALVGAVGGWLGVQAWQHRTGSTRNEQERIEALATWCEQLRDLLAADNGLLGTIEASVPTCPTALRAEVSRLSTRLARQDAGMAVRQFAREVDDPSGDLVASVLLLAMSRSGRTGELLSELAVTIRERAAMRLRVVAERSGQRSEARFVVIMGTAVIAAVIVFGQNTTFLDAYDSTTGQVVLAIVAALYGGGMVWLSRLTRFERPARFLMVGEGR